MFSVDAIVLWGCGFLLAFSALLALLRAIKGPTVLDRVVASDVLLTTLLLVLALEMIVNNHTNSVPVMIGVSATAALATITVARFVRRSAEDNSAQQQVAVSDHTDMIDVHDVQHEVQVQKLTGQVNDA